MNESDFLKVAKKAVLEAGKIISKYKGKVKQSKIKNDDRSDLVTEADIEAEKKIVQILTKNFPDHNIIGEENTRIKKNSDYTWIIDPLNGTLAFLVGMPYVDVAIGLVKNNKPVLGIVYHISEKNLYWAQDSKGAYLNGRKVRVRGNNTLDQAVVIMDLGHRKVRKEKFDRYVIPLMEKVGYIYSTGSSVPFGLISTGIIDAYIATAWVWDLTAGSVIVREAGGKVTDFEGNEPDWSKDRLSIVASNGLIHDQILEALKNP